MKHILDSVHGNIMIENDFFQIIDTPEFQRLRRIEQTSIRSVFPSARHDRFIHSLGVFHIGHLIVNHFRSDIKEECKDWDVTEENVHVIFQSYLMACLLHDVGHAPFSHTFEVYYGKKYELAEELKFLIENEEFSSDMDKYVDDAKWHEYVSAYVAYSRFKDTIITLKGDPEYVARMITGCFYTNKDKDDRQLRNCFISLLHGDLVDADRLDYACRDIWASGYSTSTIDLNRLINALHICRNDSGDLVVCFYSNVVNEIENLMTVKDFQMKYIINHHTVTYDQWLLQKAAEHTARKLTEEEIKESQPDINDDKLTVECMKRLCSIKSMTGHETLGNYDLYNPSDDDFFSIMKQDQTNEQFKEWSNRQYRFFPVWKSQEEFAHFFNIKKGTDLKNRKFDDTVRLVLRKRYKDEDFLLREIVYKPKIKLSSLYILVHNKVKRFTDIYQEDETKTCDQTFYFLYVRKPDDIGKIEEERMQLVDLLKAPIKDSFKENKE